MLRSVVFATRGRKPGSGANSASGLWKGRCVTVGGGGVRNAAGGQGRRTGTSVPWRQRGAASRAAEDGGPEGKAPSVPQRHTAASGAAAGGVARGRIGWGGGGPRGAAAGADVGVGGWEGRGLSTAGEVALGENDRGGVAGNGGDVAVGVGGVGGDGGGGGDGVGRNGKGTGAERRSVGGELRPSCTELCNIHSL